jgi:hypothetical protein
MYLVKNSGPVHPLDKLEYNKPVRQHVREFGALFGAIFLGLAAYGCYHGAPAGRIAIYCAVGAIFAGLGYLAPAVLHPIWKGWMKFAGLLGFVMSTALVSVMWWVLLVPFAVFMKMIGKRVMDMSFDRAVKTYWETRKPEESDFKLLARQY